MFLASLLFIVALLCLTAVFATHFAAQPKRVSLHGGGRSDAVLLRKVGGVARAILRSGGLLGVAQKVERVIDYMRSRVVLGLGMKRPAYTLLDVSKGFGLALAMLLLFAPLAKAAAVVGGGVMGLYTASERVELAFSENNSVDTKINRGRLLDSLVINVPWTSTVTADATAVRTRGAPIKTIQFLGDGGKVHLSIKLQDAIRKAEIYGRASLSQVLRSPSGVTAAGGPYTGNLALPIYLASRHAYAPWLTSLASWRQSRDPIVRIQFGSHAEVYRGGTGSTAVTSGAAFIEQVSLIDFGSVIPEVYGGDVDKFGDSLPFAVDSYEEKTYTAAQSALKFDLPTTMDFRAIMITGEDTNGDPLSDTEMGKISFTLKENGSVDVDSAVNLGSLRSRNSEQFNFPNGLPPGVALREWAEDRDLSDIYKASEKNKVELIFVTATPASGTYTIRVHVIGVEQRPAVQLAA